MVQFERFTGCRPEEVCLIRPCDVDAAGDVWAYRPESHKTQHHGRERVIFIGPKAQAILRPYLLRDKAAYCFCPAEGEKKRREDAHDRRTTPLSRGNRPGSNVRSKPKRFAGERYDVASYRRAIYRACELAFGMPKHLRHRLRNETEEQKQERQKLASEWRAKHTWHPNQLRHTAATEIRKRFGIESAQLALGHADANVTQIYAERDMQKAAHVMAQVG
jgi:integrase